MRKTFALIALTGLLFVSCKKENSQATAVETNQSINIDKSANIDLVKQLASKASKFDLVAFRSHFAENAILHDNMKTLTIDENIKMLEDLKASGTVFTLGKKPLIWEVVNSQPDEKTGITNYVISYYEATFTRGKKSVTIGYNMNFAIKDGKVQEEWDTYDSAPLTELLK